MRGRTDEDYSGIGNGLREGGAFGEETVTGVQGVGLHGARRGYDRFGIEIRGRSLGRPDAARVVDEPQVIGVAIGLRIDAERHDAHLARRARDADRNLAPVGDQ